MILHKNSSVTVCGSEIGIKRELISTAYYTNIANFMQHLNFCKLNFKLLGGIQCLL